MPYGAYAHPLCCRCRKAIREGDHRWAAREPEEYWHYRCATDARLTQAFKSLWASPGSFRQQHRTDHDRAAQFAALVRGP